MIVSWPEDLNHPDSKHTESVVVICMAYVDDTTWITASREQQLQEILDMARVFYLINDLQINPSKSQIMAINYREKSRKKLD